LLQRRLIRRQRLLLLLDVYRHTRPLLPQPPFLIVPLNVYRYTRPLGLFLLIPLLLLLLLVYRCTHTAAAAGCLLIVCRRTLTRWLIR
jgi:hypothetical protein